MNLVAATSLIDELLFEQQLLTAVERFSQFHETATEPGLAKHYRQLIPLSKPGPGEQYSFEVDLDACSGCKACVTACHSLNGLDEGESWREVGALVSIRGEEASHQTVTTACHHCVDPACANGCPTLAYEKEEDTGIVHHLDDQCIGCQYCTLTCPYEAPKYNARLGIVRKCDMCRGRLKEGEAPACVQACPNEAIRIRVVPMAEVAATAEKGSQLLPGTAPSRITRPTTTYLNVYRPDGREPAAADEDDLTPAHGHSPLVLMLVLTQAAAGLLLFDVLGRVLPSLPDPGLWHAAIGVLTVFAGLAGATLHLGRPLQAWRSFLGWRKSWLSREILVFGAWSGMAAAYLGTFFLDLPALIETGIALSAVALGLAGVFCSVMVYAFTKRPFWSLPQTGARFGLTLLSLGAVFVFPPVTILATALKLAHEATIASVRHSPFPRSATVLNGALRRLWHIRLGLGAASFLAASASILFPWMAFPVLALILAGELCARSLYFRAVETPKMPGGICPG